MNLPVDAASWSLAFLPLLVLLVLMLWRQWGAAEAGSVALLVAGIVAWFYFATPLGAIAYQGFKGTWAAVTVLYVVWASILIYEVSHEANAFEPLRENLTRILPDPLIQMLAFGWAFASFLQGVTGFGVPIAVCAPLLVGIGVRPLYAVIIPLIGHSWNNTFGTLAVAWLGLKQVTGMDHAQAMETALYASVFIWVLNLLGGFLVCWLYDRWSAIRHGLPAVLVMSAIQGGLTLGLSQWNDVLSGFLASTAAFIALFAISLMPRYRTAKPRTSHIYEDSIQAADGIMLGGSVGAQRVAMPEIGVEAAHASGGMTLNQAFIPYYALVVFTAGVLLVAPIKQALSVITVSVPIPATTTGLGFVNEAGAVSFTPLIHPGTFLLLAAIAGYIAYAGMGRIRSAGSVRRIWASTAHKAMPSTVAVIALIVMSDLMAGSGAIHILAEGVADVTGSAYGFLAPLVGGLGSFMTSSNLAANLLFGQFQLSTAQATGLSVSAILGAQTAGAAVGSMIAPGNVLLGTTTTGIIGQEGDVLRVTMPLFVMVVLIVGVFVLLVA